MLTGRDKARGAQAATELNDLGIKAAFIAADLGEPDVPSRIVAAALNFDRPF